jgi:hypothetical protein
MNSQSQPAFFKKGSAARVAGEFFTPKIWALNL